LFVIVWLAVAAADVTVISSSKVKIKSKMSSTSTMKKVIYREKTFTEQQAYIFGYGAGISLFSPFATVYQLCKLTPELATTSYATMGRLSAMIFLPQTFLKVAQMNISTPVKEYLNPW